MNSDKSSGNSLQLGNVRLTQFEYLLMAHWTTFTARTNHIVDVLLHSHYLFSAILGAKGVYYRHMYFQRLIIRFPKIRKLDVKIK